jgi:hypothetical protein
MGGRFFEARNVVKDYRSQSRFAQMRCALLIYHERHGAFPPTKYQARPDGPIHSWRVLLLLHLDVDAKRYSEYDFSQEWNSPKNMEALGDIPDFYSLHANHLANYVAVADNDYWPSEYALKSRLVTKGKDRFLLVEYPDSDVHWMEPKY